MIIVPKFYTFFVHRSAVNNGGTNVPRLCFFTSNTWMLKGTRLIFQKWNGDGSAIVCCHRLPHGVGSERLSGIKKNASSGPLLWLETLPLKLGWITHLSCLLHQCMLGFSSAGFAKQKMWSLLTLGASLLSFFNEGLLLQRLIYIFWRQNPLVGGPVALFVVA